MAVAVAGVMVRVDTATRGVVAGGGAGVRCSWVQVGGGGGGWRAAWWGGGGERAEPL